MHEATTVVHAHGVAIEVKFVVDASASSLRVDYTVRNEGAVAIAAFDRGNTHDVATGRLTAGTVGAPSRMPSDEGMTLSHLALALPRPAPTVPRISLAARLDPDGVLSGAFDSAIDGHAKVRYCLGVIRFDDSAFTAFEGASTMPLWRTPFPLAAQQDTVCTPWFSVATRAFESN